MNLPIYWVDAFTDRTFGGNPAAVIPLDDWLEDELLQRIANENGLSETAYFVRTGPARANLRWFTPEVEVDLCGHATLATAHVLFNELGQAESPVVFDTKSGPLSVSLRGPLIELDFPARPCDGRRGARWPTAGPGPEAERDPPLREDVALRVRNRGRGDRNQARFGRARDGHPGQVHPDGPGNGL